MFFKPKKIKLHVHGQTAINLAIKPAKKIKDLAVFKIFKLDFSKLKSLLPEIAIFLFIVLAAWAFLQSARLSAVALNVKDKIFQYAHSGAGSLKAARQSLARQDLNQASLELSIAMESFNRSQAEMDSLEKNLLGATKLLPRSRDAENLLSASVSLAKAGQFGLNFIKLASNLSFGASGLVRGEASFKDLIRELQNFRKEAINASEKIKKTNLENIPEPERKQITENLSKLDFALASSENLEQLLFLGQALFSGQKKILLVLQNQNELRPTGGFIGSVGDIRLSDGIIERLEVSSVYSLDGQLTEDIAPPAPIVSVNNRWFLRDSNWFTSFDESAKKITSFYEKAGGETPDFVVAITPKAISDILKTTGALKTPSGEEINADNLVEILQVLTQSDPEDASNEPKKILGQLFTALFQKISSLDPVKKALVLKSLQTNLSNKQVLAFSRLKETQKILEDFNWAGKIAESNRDYLLVSSANLGGTKTDLEISQSASLATQINQDGTITNLLTLTRKNNMPDIPGAENKSFIRIYVPKNSSLLDAVGFDNINFPPQENNQSRIDPDIYRWEKSQVKDVLSGTLIGQESNKTFFGNWVVLKGGETKTITLTYTLPFKLKTIDHYSLIAQKQPGSLDYTFSHSLKPQNYEAVWKNFDYKTDKDGSFTATPLLNKDLFFGMVLKKVN